MNTRINQKTEEAIQANAERLKKLEKQVENWEESQRIRERLDTMLEYLEKTSLVIEENAEKINRIGEKLDFLEETAKKRGPAKAVYNESASVDPNPRFR